MIETSGHLPECNQRETVWQKAHYSGVECICDALRACEQRVLDAAREAVAAVGVRKDTSYDMRVQALAVIDALRGSGNPGSPTPAEKGEQA